MAAYTGHTKRPKYLQAHCSGELVSPTNYAENSIRSSYLATAGCDTCINADEYLNGGYVIGGGENIH